MPFPIHFVFCSIKKVVLLFNEEKEKTLLKLILIIRN